MSNPLPPHAEEAERSVLGSILLDPATVLPIVGEWAGGDVKVFYVLAHQQIFRAMMDLALNGTPVEMVTLRQRLTDAKLLQEVGGREYLSALPEAAAPGMHEHYMKIVWGKFLARKQVQTSTEIVQQIYEWDGMPEGLWAQIHRLNEDWAVSASRNSGVAPRELVRPASLEADYKAQWWREKKEQNGWALPFALADFNIRPHEFTLLGGDSETGKSTWLKEVIVCLIKQDVSCLLATLEEPAGKALWILSRQVLGKHHKPETVEEGAQVWAALGFLEKKLWLYNFLGIGNWRNILDCFIYAADKLGVQVFVLDGIGLIGIGDEDMETQGLAAAQFAAFAHTRAVHLICVQHTVKDPEGGFKRRLRGNKRWTDFCDNLVEWERNEKKREKVTQILAEREKNDACLRAKPPQMTAADHAEQLKELNEKLEKANADYDAKVTLRKQKWGEGERRNAAKYLWLHWSSRQFHDQPGQGAQNYLRK